MRASHSDLFAPIQEDHPGGSTVQGTLPGEEQLSHLHGPTRAEAGQQLTGEFLSAVVSRDAGGFGTELLAQCIGMDVVHAHSHADFPGLQKPARTIRPPQETTRPGRKMCWKLGSIAWMPAFCNQAHRAL
jgi:hypothetical protein